MSEVRDDLKYSTDHEWAKPLEDNELVVGITDYAQHSLSDIVYAELPELGAVFQKGDSVAIIESVKAASDVNAPFDGEITRVNEALEETPELLNESPYELGWIFQMKVANLEAVLNEMLDAKAYQAQIG